MTQTIASQLGLALSALRAVDEQMKATCRIMPPMATPEILAALAISDPLMRAIRETEQALGLALAAQVKLGPRPAQNSDTQN